MKNSRMDPFSASGVPPIILVRVIPHSEAAPAYVICLCATVQIAV